MNAFVKCFSGIALSMFALSSIGQEDIDLARAIEIGLKNNYQIEIAERNLDIAENNDDWAIAGRYPTIDLTLNSGNAYNRTNNPASFLIQRDAFSVDAVPGLELSWILFDGYRVKYSKEQLEDQVQLSDSERKIAVENTIQNIINAYYEVLVQIEGLEVLEEVLNLSRDRVAYQEIRKEFGQAGTFDVLQTQDAYLNDSISYMSQLVTYENAMRNLKLSMGVTDPAVQYNLTDQLEFGAADYNLEDLKTKMFAQNERLNNLFINRELAAVNTRIQESELLPQVSLRSGLSYNVNISFGTQTFRSNDPNTPPPQIDIPQVAAKTLNGFVNLTATYNLFDAGVRKKNIENARVREMTAQLNIEDFKRNLTAQLENTLAIYNNQKRLVRVTTQLLDNARRNLEIAEERFRGGLINSFDYRTIQVGYINATQARLQAIFNLKTTETELVRLIGGLVR